MGRKRADRIKKPSSDSNIESSQEADERAAKYVYDCKSESLDFYQEKFKVFNYLDRLYIKGASKTNVPYGRANLELPLAFQQIEPFIDQMGQTMVGEAPYIAYEGRNEDDEKIAEEITDFSQYQLDNADFITQYFSWLRNYGKYGTAVMKMAWETDIITVKEEQDVPVLKKSIDPQTGLPTQTIVLKTKTIDKDYTKHDGPMFYNISLFDFFVPRSAASANIQKMDWCIHRAYRTLDQLLENVNYSKAHKRIRELIAESETEDGSILNNNGEASIKDESKRTELVQKNPNKGVKKFLGKIEVLEWWGDYKVKKNDDFSKPTLIVVALLDDEKIVLRNDPNPFKFKFKPFLMDNDYPIQGEPYGYGELHHIKGLIEESTALRNARLDVANISLNRVWLVERAAGVNLRELYTAPNKIILTNDLNGIKAMDMGGVTPSSVNELARIDFDIQNTTEIINPRQDVSNVGAAFGGTATGVNFLAGKSNSRLMTKARLQEQNFFKPLAQMLNWYNRDLVTDDTYYRVAGDSDKNPYKSISPDAFLTDVDFKPKSAPDKLSQSEKKDGLNYFMQTAAQMIKVLPNIRVKSEKLLSDAAKIAGLPHPSEYFEVGPIQVLKTQSGRLVDQNGQDVQITPVDDQGKPLPPSPAGPGMPGQTPQS